MTFGDHPKWLTTEEQTAWLAFLSAQKLLFEQLDRELSNTSGIGMDDYDVLARLSDAKGRRLRMSELAELVVMPKSRLTYRVDQLVKRGWVTRVDSDEDKRGIYAELTDLGFSAIERAAPAHVKGVREHFIDVCSPEELAALAAGLGRVGTRVRQRRGTGSTAP